MWPGFNHECQECSARSLAHGPQFFESALMQTLTANYRNALRTVFGDEWRAGHDSVKTWATRIEQARKDAP